jgi:5-formyltetrahydrofolate cyclo-ligase
MTATMPHDTTDVQKTQIRDAARKRRAEIDPGEIKNRSQRICDYLLDIIDGNNPVMVYVSKSPEVDTGTLITSLIERNGRVVVPIIERERTSLRLSYVKDPSVLVQSTFQVPEPVNHELPAHADAVKVVVVPMLAFDRQGNRLGYGRGYYDRFLCDHPRIPRIGLAFSCQEFASIPSDKNDIRMNLIVTENGAITCDN